MVSLRHGLAGDTASHRDFGVEATGALSSFYLDPLEQATSLVAMAERELLNTSA